MIAFADVYTEACLRHGEEEVLRRLPVPATTEELEDRDEARYLSLMSRRIFRAGLRHSMVDARWPAFEEVFHDFDVNRVRMLSDDDLDAMLRDARLIRHWRKLQAVRHNASVMHELRTSHGGFGRYLAAWPVTDCVGLWRDLHARFAQLGGNSGPYFLRMAGKDTFILTGDVIRALNRWGAYAGDPRSLKARRTVQECFNAWHQESGRPQCQISRILALSID
jgi:3-methyladenine DNA glycosylase Tag